MDGVGAGLVTRGASRSFRGRQNEALLGRRSGRLEPASKPPQGGITGDALPREFHRRVTFPSSPHAANAAR